MIQFFCPNAQQWFSAPAGRVQDVCGLRVVQARCPFCDANYNLRGTPQYDASIPQIHMAEVQ